MFISITFPVADYRSLHLDCAGRLERPAWGDADPQAAFARGFGSIHTRTKSGNGFVGENYYADCDNLIRYPSQYFLKPIPDLNRQVLAYPFYRRFFFDGQMAGRYELGFRLNEGSINEILELHGNVEYSVSEVVQQLLQCEVRVELLDKRELIQPFLKAMIPLRDGWLLSSTKTSALRTYDIESVGAKYVGVGAPIVFVRVGREISLAKEKQKRTLLERDQFEFYITRSGIHGQQFDIAVVCSDRDLDDEGAEERLARLFYTQVRTLAFAHSFYMRQVRDENIESPRTLEPAIQDLLDRLANLVPLEESKDDSLTCSELGLILRHLDVDTSRLALEIERLVKPGWLRRKFGGLFKYFDRKADIAIGAAASAATKQLLSGGP